METKQAGEHTQGEWETGGIKPTDINTLKNPPYVHIKSINLKIATCPFNMERKREEAEANARLIAAAPSLLQTLTEVKQALLDRGEPENSLLIVSINNTLNKTK